MFFFSIQTLSSSDLFLPIVVSNFILNTLLHSYISSFPYTLFSCFLVHRYHHPLFRSFTFRFSFIFSPLPPPRLIFFHFSLIRCFILIFPLSCTLFSCFLVHLYHHPLFRSFTSFLLYYFIFFPLPPRLIFFHFFFNTLLHSYISPFRIPFFLVLFTFSPSSFPFFYLLFLV